ncbi:MAG: diaminopimelate epimerase [Myxococcota bacterium]
MRLFRSHGLGNDYLVLEDGPPVTPDLARALCDRRTGVGGDGVLEPVDGGLRIWNPDGSEAEKSGNGIRIFAHWLVRRRGAASPLTLWTKGGVVRAWVAGDDVRVEMGVARVGEPRSVEGVTALPVDVGNPHHVVFAVPDDWRSLGARIERSVPARTNVQFVAVEGPRAVRVKVWERGAGETRSSGSSACAVAAATVATGRASSPVEVRMDGGTLRVEVGEGGAVTLEGPVEAVGAVELDAGWVARRT